jgi:hypothetical protein
VLLDRSAANFDPFIRNVPVREKGAVIHKEPAYMVMTKQQLQIYKVWQKSNETGNTVHEPTMLLPPSSHGS